MNSAAKWHVKMRLFNLCAIHFHGLLYTVLATVEPHTRVFNVHSRKASKKRVSICMQTFRNISLLKDCITFYQLHQWQKK